MQTAYVYQFLCHEMTRTTYLVETIFRLWRNTQEAEEAPLLRV